MMSCGAVWGAVGIREQCVLSIFVLFVCGVSLKTKCCISGGYPKRIETELNRGKMSKCTDRKKKAAQTDRRPLPDDR